MSDPAVDASGDPTAGLRIRDAVRAVVIDPQQQVLLVRFQFPGEGVRWALPGGGIEPGESDRDALRRELAEEVGLLSPTIGPHVWNRLHIVPFVDGRFDGQRERIYLVPSPWFEPAPHLSWQQLEAEFLFEIRWWPLADLSPGLPFAPQTLQHHLHALLRDGPPNAPVDVGV